MEFAVNNQIFYQISHYRLLLYIVNKLRLFNFKIKSTILISVFFEVMISNFVTKNQKPIRGCCTYREKLKHWKRTACGIHKQDEGNLKRQTI